MSIRTRLTLWYSALLATVIVVFGISLFTLLNWAWRSQMQDNMRSVAEQMLDTINVAFDPTSGDIARPPLQRQLAQIAYSAGAMFVQVWDRDQRLIEQTPNTSFGQPFAPDALLLDYALVVDSALEDGTHVMVSNVPIVDTLQRRIGTLQIMAPLTMLEAATNRLLRVMIGVGIVAVVVSFAFGTVIAGQALQPVETISQIARQITAADDLSKRIPYDGPMDELGQLTTVFNTTLARLEKLFVAQRRFVADVSHELRTPLTAIQGNVDMIRRFYPDLKNSPEVEAITSESGRMTRLVGDLLLLAQADSGRLPLRWQVVELETLTFEVFRQAQILAGPVEVRLGTLDAVRVNGDPDRLKQLLLNLISNALKFTPAGGKVTLSLMQDGAYAVLSVRDTGIGIPHADLPYIFDRFYRVDKARAREMGGAGLGLSIAQWIAEAHNGRIWAESEPGLGSTFFVQIPRLDATDAPESQRETRQRMPALLRRPKTEG